MIPTNPATIPDLVTALHAHGGTIVNDAHGTVLRTTIAGTPVTLRSAS